MARYASQFIKVDKNDIDRPMCLKPFDQQRF